jgi:cytochrome c-type biogenesis protein CcmH/NrfG
MLRYRRTPALIVLVVMALLGVGYVLAWDRVERLWKKSPGEQSIQALEKRMADGDKSAGTWSAYAEALAKAKEHARAANAYKELIKLEPGKKEAKFQCAVCLANAAQGENRYLDELYNFLNELLLAEPKLTMEILDRPETQKFMGEDRFVALKTEAKNQAMD